MADGIFGISCSDEIAEQKRLGHATTEDQMN
jgi:hypothetical protein